MQNTQSGQTYWEGLKQVGQIQYQNKEILNLNYNTWSTDNNNNNNINKQQMKIKEQ